MTWSKDLPAWLVIRQKQATDSFLRANYVKVSILGIVRQTQICTVSVPHVRRCSGGAATSDAHSADYRTRDRLPLSAIPEQGAVQDTWQTSLVIAKTPIKP